MPSEPSGVTMARWVGFAALFVWLIATGPWLIGREVLIQRDVMLANVPYKAYGAQQLAEGRIPAINTAWGLGQPYRGNPGTLPFYPGNVLYMVLPFWAAFGAHYALHWLLAGVAMAILARRLGASPPAAVLAGLTYCGGVVTAAISFYNTLAVLAWWPLVLAGIVGRSASGSKDQSLTRQTLADRRGLVLGSLACGMAILGGEPVALVLLSPTAVLLAWGPGRGLATACLRSALTFGLGLLLAAPQAVATARVLRFSSRGGPGEETAESLGFSLDPTRVLELFVPFPFGIPFRDDAWGYWAAASSQLPYYYALFTGILTVPLLLLAIRRRPLWTLAVAAGFSIAWLGAEFHWLATLSAGMFRHPEKFLLWATPILPLLVARGFDRLRRDPHDGDRLFLALAALPALGLAAVAVRFDAFVDWQAGRLLDRAPPGAPHAQAILWVAWLSLLVAAFLVSAWSLRRGRADWLLPVQLASLLPLLALLPTDSTDYYGTPELRSGLGERTAIWSPLHLNLSKLTHPAPRYYDHGLREGSRWIAQDLDPSVGIPSGLTYPIVVDLDGLASPLLRPIYKRIAAMPEPEQLRWLRALGVEAVVMHRARSPALPILAEHPSPDGPVVLQAVTDTMPRILWPESFETVDSVRDAYRHVSRHFDPVARPALLESVEQGQLRSLTIVEWTPDRIVFDIDSSGGAVVLARAFQPLYRIRALSDRDGPVTLRPLLANAFLLAVEVPSGPHRVELQVSGAPEGLALLASLVTLAGLIVWLRKDS